MLRHEEAEATMAAERYVLGELHDSELEQFEEHFFSCPECAQDVRDLAAITDAAITGAAIADPAIAGAAIRDAWAPASEQPRTAEPRTRLAAAPSTASHWAWFRLSPSLAWGGALAAVTLFAVYQTTQLREAMRPQALPAIVLTPQTRGEAAAISIGNAGPFLRPLAVDLPGFTGTLQWDIQRAGSQNAVFQGTAEAPEPGQMFQVLLPSSKLALGDYMLTVRSTTPAGKSRFFKFKLTSSGR
jgi:hypothetical protein